MKQTVIYAAIILLLFLNVVSFLFLKSRTEKTVVIDIVRLFNEFELKNELEGRVELKLNDFTARIDSLKALAEIAADRNDSSRLMRVEEQLYLAQNEAQQALQVSNQTINEQVWKRLNPLIDEFGKREKYRVIIGANGMGSVLYKDDVVDATSQLIHFVNEKYEKGG